ncbi:hypothetical protein [Streptomyces sp. NBC_01429]|uniref:hypothetical protein n=1 Tax=Streptomyces sp. NBC_01429 TaxID=2903862 RepID=UPI002E28CF68|nr:hypothetical protein [Streptomyces sp. NBC_01429]
MGLEFGYHLGLPSALPGLPLAPLVPGYRELLDRQRALGLRHLGEALVARGGRLRVLDGVYLPRAPRGWRRLDGDTLRRLQGSGSGDGALLRRLETLHDRDPQALRRVLLYQLTELLQDDPDGARAETAVALGVDPDEAAALVYAARARRRLNRDQRGAAEGLEDAWRDGRLRGAVRLAALLPADGGQDPPLARRLRRIAARERETAQVLDRARLLDGAGDTEGAGEHYLRAVRLASDSGRALRGLVGAHLPAEGAPERLTARLAPDAVELSWDTALAQRVPDSWRVIRLTCTPGRSPIVAGIPARGTTRAGSARDASPPFGSEVRYAVLPLRGGRADAPPLVSAPLRVMPEVTGLVLTDGPERLEAAWHEPPRAAGVTVTLTDSEGREVDAGTPSAGFTARGLAPGAYRVRIRCHYRAGNGRDVASPGVEASGTVRVWPRPVLALTAEPHGGGVRFGWTGGAGATVRLVEWTGAPPAPGTELPAVSAASPAPLDWPRTGEVSFPPPGTTTRVVALAVLGDRAVAGPDVLVDAPHPVTGLTVERTDEGLARIGLDWPDGAGQVTVAVTQDGRHAEHRVTRSVFVREGLYVPVARSGARVAATPVTTVPDAVVVPLGRAETVLPSEVIVAYGIIPGPRRPLRRKPATVRVTLRAPDDEPASGLPEFVLVARSGDSRSPVRPRDPGDGTVVLRLSGAELRRAGTVERALQPAGCPPPYALRGFLLGGRAASVRLQEPSPAHLVVR